ncbi:MAG: tetratricopeptide repeat protein [Saprospiraceae bacterium]|nr:tetratricopeptide repeat protein [Saprospiraceae bacterium]
MGRKTTILLVFFLLLNCCANAQSIDSILIQLQKLEGREKIAFTNEHFYTLYATDFSLGQRLLLEADSLADALVLPNDKAIAQRNLGIIYYLKGEYEQALAAYQIALTYFEKADDISGVGLTLKEMGNFFKKQKQYPKALEVLDRGIDLCKSVQDTDCITQNLDIKAVVLIEMDSLDAAKTILYEEEMLLKAFSKGGDLSYPYNHLSEIALLQGEVENAANLLQKSTAIRAAAGDRQGVAINTNNLGEIYLNSGRPVDAIPFFKDALSQSKEIGFTDLTRHIMEMLSRSYAQLNESEEALKWLKESYAVKDSLFNVDRTEKLAEMDAKYEAAKKATEIAEKDAALQKQTIKVIGLSAALFLVVIAFVFVGRVQQQKRIKAELQAEIASREAANKIQEERLRISRDLHDNLGAELTLIGSALNRKAFTAQSEEEKSDLESISKNTREAMGQLRETIWAIRKDSFYLEDLVEKIREFGQRAGSLHLDMQVGNPKVRLGPGQTLNLYRIAQESITNAVKHGNARVVSLLWTVEGNQLVMQINDDGKGVAGKKNSGGYGLQNMKSRAEELGGSFSFSSPGTGTQTLVSIPL